MIGTIVMIAIMIMYQQIVSIMTEHEYMKHRVSVNTDNF